MWMWVIEGGVASRWQEVEGNSVWVGVIEGGVASRRQEPQSRRESMVLYHVYLNSFSSSSPLTFLSLRLPGAPRAQSSLFIWKRFVFLPCH